MLTTRGGDEKKASEGSPQLFAGDSNEEATPENTDGVGRSDDGVGEGGGRLVLLALLTKGIVPRWRTRVLAVECLRDVLRILISPAAAPSDSPGSKGKGSHRLAGTEWLSDLVAVGFTAATASVNILRPAGLGLLQDLIAVTPHILPPPCLPPLIGTCRHYRDSEMLKTQKHLERGC